MKLLNSRFKISDFFQQVVGSFLLAGPFVVTEEVWLLASNMTWVHLFATITVGVFIAFTALFKADKGRDINKEPEILGVPVRFISLLLTAYLSVTILSLMFAVPQTFDTSIVSTINAISIAGIFAIIGAATADSVF